jgi:hypothetical protein
MGIIKKGILKAQVNDLGLYSNAEEIALNMRQKKGRGDDTRRFFVKNGVKAEELKALGLDELFKQERVTQQEILDRINQNRVEFEETVSTGPAEGDVEFDYDDEPLDIEEAYGSDYVESEVDYFLGDAIGDYILYDDRIIDDLARDFSVDQDDMDEIYNTLQEIVANEASIEDLPSRLQGELRDRAEEMVRLSYDDNPVRRITVNITDQNAETTDIGDMGRASFSYSLVGNEDMGFGISGLESVPDSIRRQIENSRIYSPEEVVVQLRGIAEQYDEIDVLAGGETRWGEYTLDGGENYQEARLSLPGKGETKFREGVHFPDDINNVFHVRTKDREGPMGEKILYVEEVQSDWAQQGRKKGFKNKKKVEDAEQAANALLDEAVPLLLQIEKSDVFQDGRKFGNTFEASIGSLSDALSIAKQANRSLDAAGEIVTAVENAKKEALLKTNSRVRNNYLESLSLQEKIDIYVGQTMGDFGANRGTDALLRQVGPEEARKIVEAEARDLAVNNQDKLDLQVLNYGEQQGLLPDLNVGLRQAIPANENFNAVFQQVLEEQRSFLKSKGIDPMLYSKLQSALDKADPKGAKMRAEREQRDLPAEAPFVLDTDSWNRLAVKYIFKKAAEEGYDGVSFAPAEAHIDRWGDEGLAVQYDQNLPRAIDKVIGEAPVLPSNRPEMMEVDGYESKIYHLDNLTKDGDSIADKMKAPTTMFGFTPLPLVMAEYGGVAGLKGLSEEEKAFQRQAAEEAETMMREPAPSEGRGIMALGDALRGAGEVGYEALSDLLLEPFAGMAGAEAAFEMGATPEEVEAARRRASALIDFETQSPTGQRYKEALKSGIGSVGSYLMEDTQSLDPLQFGFQKLLVPASEAVTDAALGIMALDPRDTPEMEKIRQEAARPVVEAIQPI